MSFIELDIEGRKTILNTNMIRMVSPLEPGKTTQIDLIGSDTMWILPIEYEVLRIILLGARTHELESNDSKITTPLTGKSTDYVTMADYEFYRIRKGIEG